MIEEYKHITIKDNKLEFGNGWGDGLEGLMNMRHEDIIGATESMLIDGYLVYILNDDFVEQQQLYVSIDKRQKGYATKLFKAFEKKVKETNCKKIIIKVVFNEVDVNPFQDFLIKLKYKEDKQNCIWYKNL